MPENTATDRLSLAPPDWRTALKRRVRRPRKPTRNEAITLCQTVVFGLVAVQQLLQAHYFYALDYAILTSLCWKAYHCHRAGQPIQGILISVTAIIVAAVFLILSPLLGRM